MAMSNERAKEIMGIAHAHWLDYMSFVNGKYVPKDLFDITKARINSCASEFFTYCSEIELGVGGASIGQTSSLAVSGSPSWLWQQRGVPVILIDYGVIGANIPDHSQRKVITRIILHEVGHVILHFKDILALGGLGGAGANETQEEEAWLFSSAIIGLALGQIAPSGRPAIKDCAWTMSA